MVPNIVNENYNETVLIPLLQEKLNDLTTQAIVLEAKLRIANKEKAEMEKKIAAMSAATSNPPATVGTALEAEVDG